MECFEAAPPSRHFAPGTRVRVLKGRRFKDFGEGDAGTAVHVNLEAGICEVAFDGRSSSLQVALRHLEPFNQCQAALPVPHVLEPLWMPSPIAPVRAQPVSPGGSLQRSPNHAFSPSHRRDDGILGAAAPQATENSVVSEADGHRAVDVLWSSNNSVPGVLRMSAAVHGCPPGARLAEVGSQEVATDFRANSGAIGDTACGGGSCGQRVRLQRQEDSISRMRNEFGADCLLACSSALEEQLRAGADGVIQAWAKDARNVILGESEQQSRRGNAGADDSDRIDATTDDGSFVLAEAVQASASAQANATASALVEVVSLRLAIQELRELLLHESEERVRGFRSIEERMEDERIRGLRDIEERVEAMRVRDVSVDGHSLQSEQLQLARKQDHFPPEESPNCSARLEERLRCLDERVAELMKRQMEASEAVRLDERLCVLDDRVRSLTQMHAETTQASQTHLADLEHRQAQTHRATSEVRDALETQFRAHVGVLQGDLVARIDDLFRQHAAQKAKSLANSGADPQDVYSRQVQELDGRVKSLHAELSNSIEALSLRVEPRHSDSLAVRVDKLSRALGEAPPGEGELSLEHRVAALREQVRNDVARVETLQLTSSKALVEMADKRSFALREEVKEDVACVKELKLELARVAAVCDSNALVSAPAADAWGDREADLHRRLTAEAVRVGQRASEALEAHCEAAREREKMLEVMHTRMEALSSGLAAEARLREEAIERLTAECRDVRQGAASAVSASSAAAREIAEVAEAVKRTTAECALQGAARTVSPSTTPCVTATSAGTVANTPPPRYASLSPRPSLQWGNGLGSPSASSGAQVLGGSGMATSDGMTWQRSAPQLQRPSSQVTDIFKWPSPVQQSRVLTPPRKRLQDLCTCGNMFNSDTSFCIACGAPRTSMGSAAFGAGEPNVGASEGKFETLFNALDRNHDGVISRNEWNQGLGCLGVPANQPDGGGSSGANAGVNALAPAAQALMWGPTQSQGQPQSQLALGQALQPPAAAASFGHMRQQPSLVRSASATPILNATQSSSGITRPPRAISPAGRVPIDIEVVSMNCGTPPRR
eukprot:TRINITY_DN37703_c0_g1_i1.p1 TRINITY_DN37703_c0_g1~~TRINITY_DN37703_c0_g1_i1.p1  ORF type:complete len:1070 (-),score=240.94 TRINITY_DN37703_c0_g1_i1:109-3318(-)